MNTIALIGRTTSKPEYQDNGDYALAKFTLAVDRNYKKDGEKVTDFIPCIAWGGRARFLSNYVGKGQKIGVVGSLEIDSFTGDDGQFRTFTQVNVRDITFAGESKAGKEEDDYQPSQEEINNLPFDL